MVINFLGPIGADRVTPEGTVLSILANTLKQAASKVDCVVAIALMVTLLSDLKMRSSDRRATFAVPKMLARCCENLRHRSGESCESYLL